jgi:starch-binding outer membrane protein, SusD/RagB family
MGINSYWHVKLTYEYDLPMLHSPIYFRLAEMYLIKAEAYAKLDNAQLALDNVNIIRQRAGLSGDQLFTPGDLKGYPTVLDVVLDERRLELAWEAHRPADVFRNKRTMDRSYKAWQGWSGPSSIPYTSDRIIHLIPEVEMTRNPNLVQNPTTNY